MSKKGIIFDLDGTVLDSMPAWNNLDRRFLNEHNIEYHDSIEEEIKKMSFIQSCEFFVKKYKLNMTPTQVMIRMKQMMYEDYRYKIPMKPYLEVFLKQEIKKGVLMCIATATHIELAEMALKRLGINQYIKFVLTCQCINTDKTKPDIYIESAKKLGTEVKDTLVFEDALHCVITAKAAGFKVIAVEDNSALCDREEIMKNADCYIKSYKELII